ncbi:MAG: NAD-dependent epimerase/dehydratase family protein [Planctomycetaceae bacterium]|jgi:nucleoside-diphosphate-sugar epimerase|nr:NAD-dependent epimerase/dehydratase family protein [Planctomycetaceae bacterium]
MSKVLVTGGGGFLGQHIVEQLAARGDQVRTFGRNRYQELERWNVEQFQGNLCSREDVFAACTNIDTVFHTAAIPAITCQWKPFYETNIIGTQNVIHACLENGVKKLIYTSSPCVVFDGKEKNGVDESVPYPDRWLAHYPHSKAVAEKMILNHNGCKGLLTCSLRPHLIWGPGDKNLIPRLLERALSGHLHRVGDGTNLVDTIYVDNAAEAHLQAADALAAGSPVAGSAYFLSQGDPVNCWKWIDELLDLAGLPPVRKAVSLNHAWIVGTFLEKVYTFCRFTGEPVMTRFLATQLALSHWFDISRAQRDFGYTPTVSTTEGMHRLRQYFQELEINKTVRRTCPTEETRH